MYRWARGENLPHQVSLFPLEQKTKKIISVPFGLQEGKGFRVHTGSFAPQIPLLRGPNCRKAEDRSAVRASGHQHLPPHQGSKKQNLRSLNYNSHSTRFYSGGGTFRGKGRPFTPSLKRSAPLCFALNSLSCNQRFV